MTTTACRECGAIEGARCTTKGGKPTKNHAHRAKVVRFQQAKEGKITYQPTFRSGIIPPTPTTIRDDAARYVLLSESFGWTDDTTTPLEWIKLLIADYDHAFAHATEEMVDEHRAELGAVEEERDELQREVESMTRALENICSALP